MYIYFKNVDYCAVCPTWRTRRCGKSAWGSGRCKLVAIFRRLAMVMSRVVGRECEECSMECGMWSVEFRVWSIWSLESGEWSMECGVWSMEWSVECGVWIVDCGVWSVECGV